MMSTERKMHSPSQESCNATAKKLISPKSSNFFIYTNVPKVEDSRVCPICGEEAPRGETHHPHYGGICCYSCRAFFRRAHQRTKTPKLTCKKDGNCPIVAKEKHLCKKCRYTKCLSIGMNAKWVLSNEEKRVRFEKFFKRKDEEIVKPLEENSEVPLRKRKPVTEKVVRRRGRKRRLEPEESPDLDEQKLGSSHAPPTSEWSDPDSEDSTKNAESENIPLKFEDCLPDEKKFRGQTLDQSNSTMSFVEDLVKPKQDQQNQSGFYHMHKQPNLEPVVPPWLKKTNFAENSLCNGGYPFTNGRSEVVDPRRRPFSHQAYNTEQEESTQMYRRVATNLQNQFSKPSPRMTMAFNVKYDFADNSIQQPQNWPLQYYSNYIQQSKSQESFPAQISHQVSRNVWNETCWNPDRLPNNFPHFSDQRSVEFPPNFRKSREPLDLAQNFTEEFSTPPWFAKNNSFCPGGFDSFGREGETWVSQKPRPQSLFAQMDKEENTTPFVLNVSGANFLIQRLPREPQNGCRVSIHENFDPRSQPYLTTRTENEESMNNKKSQVGTMDIGVSTDLVPVKTLATADGQQTILGRLSSVMDSFSIISSKTICDAVKAGDLVANHLRRSPLQKSTLISQSTMIAKMVTEFAMSQFLFMSLDPTDRLTLLKYNAPLYVQYILARYFFAETGMEQLTWILEGQVPISSLDEITNLRRITFNEYNQTVNFIPSSDKAVMYSHHIENIGLFYPFPENCNALVANLLLYHTDETIFSSLVEPKRISCIFEDARDLVNAGHKFLDRRLSVEVSSNIRPLINALKKMKGIFEDCCVPNTGIELLPNLGKPFVVSYTNTEESWLKRQFQMFREEFHSVAPPKRYLDELIALLLYNEKVSDDHISLYVQMATERMKRVIKIHQEFNNLTGVDQENILQRNIKVGLSLTIARLNLYKSGKEQLRSALGHLGDNDTHWETLYRWPFDLTVLKRAHLEQNEVHLGKMNKDLIVLFTSLFRDVSELVPNDELYQIFTLISMLDTTGLPESEGISEMFKMRQIYLKLFQRRLAANGFPQLTYDRFKQILAKLLQFADIMTSMFSL